MKDQLKILVNTLPSQSFTQILKSKYPAVYDWVISLTDDTFDTFKERVHWILNPEPLICDNGCRKKFVPKDTRWGFCNGPAHCKCHCDAVTTRAKSGTPFGTDNFNNIRKDTWIKKYGVDNPMKLQIHKDAASTRGKSRRHTTDRLIQYKNNGFAQVTERINSEGFSPMFTAADYCGSNRQNVYKWKCNTCHLVIESHVDYGTVPRCPSCNPKEVSSYEHELRAFLQEHNINAVYNSRDIIPPHELDIYIPDYKLAIEFNGIYWHSDKKKTPNYHLNKFNRCRDLNIRLIQIFESEWKNSRSIVESRLKNILGKDITLYARHCSVKEVSGKESTKFLSKFHLQGPVSAEINLGLFHENNLVGVMTFGKPRFRNNQTYELLRFCTSNTVVGGAGKLFKYFLKLKNPKSVLSYADRCWSAGELYRKLGFVDVTPDPNNIGYFYHKNGKDYHRSSLTKQRLINLGFDKNKTADQILAENGYLKIYNCGNYKFIYTHLPK